MADNDPQHNHWCDGLAHAITQRHGGGSGGGTVTCAAGISPSGTVHIGNFREIITVDLVVRALRDRDLSVRFLYFWDDYDALRAIPAAIGDNDWREHLRKPLAAIPDWRDADSSYARYNEHEVERVLPSLGIEPQYVYQYRHYRQGEYADMIRLALEKRDTIRAILDTHRSRPLEREWWPIVAYSSFTGKDTTTIVDWDGEWQVTYRCHETDNTEAVDLRTADCIKLRWRVDWPMRWAHNGIDFEPAGKDHHSEGGSYDTASEMARRVFDISPPISVQYDFIRIKGGSGKMSSSSGELLSIAEVLSIYQPQVLRYLFASTRPNVEFAISFDEDVIKIYEDYDKCERIAQGTEQVSERRAAKERRIYELSQCATATAADAVGDEQGAGGGKAGSDERGVTSEAPTERGAGGRQGADGERGATAAATGTIGATDAQATDATSKPTEQVPFRHLCNVLQIYEGDIERAVESFAQYHRMNADHQARVITRARCAWHWIANHASERFKFALIAHDIPIGDVVGDMTAAHRGAFRRVATLIAERFERCDAKQLHSALYAIASESGLSFGELCRLLYTIIIGRRDGPQLAGFMMLIGKERLAHYFNIDRIEE